MRHLTPIDTIVCQVDTALRTLFPPLNRASSRPTPWEELPSPQLSADEKRHVAGLMRVNHSGEVSAQGLYQGQALTAKLPMVREQMNQAALEEVDHLAWCEARLHELGASPSHLNILWYFGSVFIGALAGWIGDAYSLGFVAETEKQVTQHLQAHLERLPHQDEKTRALLEMMKEDEMHHGQLALDAGAHELPLPIKWLMGGVSKIMTYTSYYL